MEKTMKRVFATFVMSFLLFFVTNTAIALTSLRFGNELISIGDLKQQVRVKCGEPISKETIGYIDRVESEKRIRVMEIEEWIFEVNNYGTIYYYSLVFEGNQLTEIKEVGEKKVK